DGGTIELARPHLANHRGLVAHHAARVDLDVDRAVGARLDLARDLLERLVPGRAIGSERRDLEDGLRGTASDERRAREDDAGRGGGGLDEGATVRLDDAVHGAVAPGEEAAARLYPKRHRASPGP